MDQQLSENEKDLATKGAVTALVTVCKMNNIDFMSQPEPIRKSMLDCFIEGVRFVRDMIPAK